MNATPTIDRTFYPFKITLDISRLSHAQHEHWLEEPIQPSAACREIELAERAGDQQVATVHAEDEAAARAAMKHMIGRTKIVISKVEGLN